MNNTYTPSITEAHTPDDGGWTTYGESNVLLLSIRQFTELVQLENKGYSYAWLWDESSNGYIFCIKLNSGEERAILFAEDHAGKLLMESEGSGVFTIALTSLPLEQVDDATTILWLPGIELNPQP
ncbi:hypothetical protein [Pseudalkalibacillus berkeleyi]|uniref:Uncharacterized protein n=1 Tax=Pseudalkalibacillus berkeleyi TaxID=1069813 RepID=A0ABS9H305_9BACL|nr:hypothetical protein [Pseudalkalibacillus berkeleyi]MCF6138345.1 hypothetical protein [Pseudalkalibacillus berkeleyi]